VQSAMPAGEWELIREALRRGQLTGTKRFSNEIEASLGGGLKTGSRVDQERMFGNKSVPFFPFLKVVF